MQFTHTNAYNTPTWSWLGLWHSLTMPFHNWLSEEPQIEQHKNHKGQIEWRIYDPTNGHIIWLGSEAEVFEWLESRYRTAISH